MNRKLIHFLITGLIFSLAGCDSPFLSPEEVSKSFWDTNIKEGQLFSSANNFTLNRTIVENGIITSSGTIKNDYGKIHIDVINDIDVYYEINKDWDCTYYYFDEDEGWLKEPNTSIGNFLGDILNYTILYPFEFETFAFDKEKLAYTATNFVLDDVTVDSIEFKFLDKNIVSFTAILDTVIYSLFASDFKETSVTLPEATVVDNTNPYNKSKYKLITFTADESEYKGMLEEEFTDADLYIFGDAWIDADFVKEVNDTTVVYYCNGEDYSRKTKSFNIRLGKRSVYGKDIDQGIEKIQVTGNALFSNTGIEFTFEILENKDGKKDKEAEPVIVNALATYEFIENIEKAYEYVYPGEVFHQEIANKKIVSKGEVTINADHMHEDFRDLVSNGYLVISDLEKKYSEFHLNDGTVLLGTANFEMQSRDFIYFEFKGMYNPETSLVKSYQSSADIRLTDGKYICTLYLLGAVLIFEVDFTDVHIETTFNEVIDNYNKVTEEVWNYIFNNRAPLLEDSIMISHHMETESGHRSSWMLITDGKIQKTSYNAQSEETVTEYYEIVGNAAYEYYYSENGSKWYKRQTDYASLQNMIINESGLNYAYKFADFEYIDNYIYKSNSVAGYQSVEISFEYGSLRQIILRTSDSLGESYDYQYGYNPVDLPDLNA